MKFLAELTEIYCAIFDLSTISNLSTLLLKRIELARYNFPKYKISTLSYIKKINMKRIALPDEWSSKETKEIITIYIICLIVIYCSFLFFKTVNILLIHHTWIKPWNSYLVSLEQSSRTFSKRVIRDFTLLWSVREHYEKVRSQLYRAILYVKLILSDKEMTIQRLYFFFIKLNWQCVNWIEHAHTRCVVL